MLTVRRDHADPSRQALAALELEVAEREAALTAIKIELQQLQANYLSQVGALYGELAALDAALLEEEIRRGLRPPPAGASEGDADGEDDGDGDGDEDDAACAHRAQPSADLKRMFRELARTIHPDMGRDDAARYRRHSLMAEANRAYAERDLDRLRLILRTWERSPEAILGDDPDANRERLQRRIEELRDRRTAIEREMSELRDSAIGRLQRRIDGARAQGWDLFAEMIRHVEREVAAARSRLASLTRTIQVK